MLRKQVRSKGKNVEKSTEVGAVVVAQLVKCLLCEHQVQFPRIHAKKGCVWWSGLPIPVRYSVSQNKLDNT